MSKEESEHPTPPAKPASTSPTAAKPAATAAKPAGSGSKTVPRRSFLSWMTLAWTAFTLAGCLLVSKPQTTGVSAARNQFDKPARPD